MKFVSRLYIHMTYVADTAMTIFVGVFIGEGKERQTPGHRGEWGVTENRSSRVGKERLIFAVMIGGDLQWTDGDRHRDGVLGPDGCRIVKPTDREARKKKEQAKNSESAD